MGWAHPANVGHTSRTGRVYLALAVPEEKSLVLRVKSSPDPAAQIPQGTSPQTTRTGSQLTGGSALPFTSQSPFFLQLCTGPSTPQPPSPALALFQPVVTKVGTGSPLDYSKRRKWKVENTLQGSPGTAEQLLPATREGGRSREVSIPVISAAVRAAPQAGHRAEPLEPLCSALPPAAG